MWIEMAEKKAEMAKYLPKSDAADLPHKSGGGEEGDDGAAKVIKKGKGKKKAE